MIRRRPGSGTAFSARTATWLVAAVVASIFSILVSQLKVFSPVESAAIAALAPFESALSAAVSPVDDFVDHFGEFGDLQSENERLRAENEQLSTDIAGLREVEAAYADLSRLLDVTASRPDDTFAAASVVIRSAGRYESAIAVDRGSNDGIVEGMVVVSTAGSIVGQVSSVLPGFSWVRLINDSTSRIPAIVQNGRADGILVGRANGEMRLELLPQGAAIEAGEIIVTSGLGGQMPKGLPLGRVVNVGGSDQDLFPTVFVEPLTSLRSLENVLILTSFRPGGITGFQTAESQEPGEPTPGAPATGDRVPEAQAPAAQR